MKPTQHVSDLVAALKHVTGLLEASGVDELPAATHMYIDITAADGPDETVRKSVVDRFAAVTGQPASYESVIATSKYADYETLIDGYDEPWHLRAYAMVRRPDPAAELAAENARLREQLAELAAVREPAVLQTAAGNVYECCGKVGRISRHEPWCNVGGVSVPAPTGPADESDAVPALKEER